VGQRDTGRQTLPSADPRAVAALSWNSSTGARIVWSVEALHDQNYADGDGHTFILVRAVAKHGSFPEDNQLLEFDARFETTMYPAHYLWGSGTRAEAVLWLDEHQPTGDSIEPVDRVLLLREHNGIVYLPMRPEAAAGIPAEHRSGRWQAVRTDFPHDAYAHARGTVDSPAHRARLGRDCLAKGCPVHILCSGNHHEVLTAAAAAVGPITPAWPPPVGVPALISLPNRF